MKKKIFLFASLAAFVLPLTVGCKKDAKVTAMTTDEAVKIIDGLEDMADSIKNVSSSQYQFIYDETYGEVEYEYEMEKKIYENRVAISTGTGKYTDLVQEMEWNVIEQTFRKTSRAYTIHDETDSGITSLSYKMTREGSRIVELLYSGVDKTVITDLQDLITTDQDGFELTQQGNKRTISYKSETENADDSVVNISVKIVCEVENDTYTLQSYDYLQSLYNDKGDLMVQLDNKYTYTTTSNGTFSATDTLLDEADYVEWYPEMEVTPVEVEGNVSDTELRTVVSDTLNATIEATSTHNNETIIYNAGTNAGMTIVVDYTLRHYTGEGYGTGILYGEGYEMGYLTDVTPEDQRTKIEFVTQSGITEREGSHYSYNIRDYKEASYDEYDNVQYSTSTVSADAPVDLRDSIAYYYLTGSNSVIGRNYVNVDYAAVKDESTGHVTLYMNLAFTQDESNPAVRQHFVVEYDETNRPVMIQYTEMAYTETNMQTDTPYYVYVQTIEYNYDETFEPITLLDPADYPVSQ